MKWHRVCLRQAIDEELGHSHFWEGTIPGECQRVLVYVNRNFHVDTWFDSFVGFGIAHTGYDDFYWTELEVPEEVEG